MDFAGPVLIAVVVIAALLVLTVIGLIYAKVRFKIATPDEAREMLQTKGRDSTNI